MARNTAPDKEELQSAATAGAGTERRQRLRSALETPVGASPTLLAALLEGRGWNVVRGTTDLVLLYLAAISATVGAPAAGVEVADSASVWVLPVIVVTVLTLRGTYGRSLQVHLLDWVGQIVGVTSLTAMSLLALETLFGVASEGTELLVRAWLFGLIYTAGGRILLGLIQRSAQRERIVGKRALIVGAGRVGAQIERRLETHPELGLFPVGYLDGDPLTGDLVPGRAAPVLGPPSDLGRIVEETGAQHVIFAFLSSPDDALVPLVRECWERGLEISLVPRLYDSVNARVELEHMGGLPLYELKGTNPRGWQFQVKHLLGRVLAVVLMVVLAPLLIAVVIAVKLTSRGPLLFRQRRIGRDGKEFELLKFRSMTVEQESSERDRPLRAVDDDLGPGGVEQSAQRLTPIGRFIRKTSIDELPQLWNVVRGEMTLVGPRPERPEFVELFGQSIRRYDERHRVKSGITGWAQVHGLRGRTSLADRVEWDNYYIENWSLWLDLKILLMTLAAPLNGRDE